MKSIVPRVVNQGIIGVLNYVWKLWRTYLILGLESYEPNPNLVQYTLTI